MGFVYSPLIAAFFTPFAYMPRMLCWIVWLGVNAGVFLIGIEAVLRAEIYPNLTRQYYWVAFLLLLPLVLPSLDVTQANPLLIGLLMSALAAVHAEKWSLAAVCVALAAYLKIYPLAFGLLILTIAPRRFGWRLLLALIVLGLLPFLLQHSNYVRDQYHSWFVTRMADDRLSYSEQREPLDLWFLLVRIGGLAIKPWMYKGIQILSGAVIAFYCVLFTRKGWPRQRMLAGLFSLTSIWMTLCGPATEGLTYAILAPAVVFASVQAFVEPRPAWLRGIVCSAFALLLLAVAKNSLMPSLNHIYWVKGMQPLAALVFLCYCLFWLLDDSQWRSIPTGTSTVSDAMPGTANRLG